MSIQALLDRLSEAPMVKLAPPFALGILVEHYIGLPIGAVVLLAVIAALGAYLFHRGSALLLLLLAAGYLAAALQRDTTPLPLKEPLTLEVRLLDDGVRRGDRLRYEARLERWKQPTEGTRHAGRGRILLYTDTLTALQGGACLRIEEAIYPFRSDSTSYAETMYLRGYIGRCYLNQFVPPDHAAPAKPTLHLLAARRLHRTLATECEAGAVVRAMTVADRSDLTPALRNAYSRSGTAHLLAVSGLHTGILFLWLNLLLWWLPILHRGHRLRNLLVIGALWLFVAAAGFPVSAVRAAVMCSLLQIARFSSSRYRALNGWAAALLLLLLVRPTWLFDVGFQLSFLSVGAILLWGVPLTQVCRTRYRLLNWMVDAVAISLVTTLATLPLVAYRFGVISWIGIAINPLAILLGTVIVAFGIALLLLPWAAPLLRPMVLQVAEWQNLLAAKGAAWELGSLDYRPSFGVVVAVYLLFLIATVVRGCRERKKIVHL